MTDDDRAYYERRVRQERERAQATGDSSVAAVHSALAAGYELMLVGAPRDTYADTDGVR